MLAALFAFLAWRRAAGAEERLERLAPTPLPPLRLLIRLAVYAWLLVGVVKVLVAG